MLARLQVLGRVLGNPRLRRVELAFLAFGAGEHGVWVAVLVYAYERGGTGMAAAIAVVQLVPAAVVAPLATELSDRFGAGRMLGISYVAQAITLLGTGAAFLAGAPSVLGYACAVLAASAVTLTRPAQCAVLPALVRAPSELTAANAVSSWTESMSMLIGPALAGALIAVDGPGAAVSGFGVALAGCAMVVQGLGERGTETAGEAADVPAGSGVLAACAATPAIPALLALFCVEYAVEGALDVLAVVIAVHELGLGHAGPGYLQAMFGVGAVLGGVGAVALVGRRRMAGPVLWAAALCGAAFIALGQTRAAVAAFVLIAVCGGAHSVLDTGGRTLLHRAVPPALHYRMFGALEGLAMAGLAVGSLSVPLLVHLGGTGTALSVAGVALVAVALAVVVAVRGLDAHVGVSAEWLELLRRCPLFTALGAPALEDLGRALVPVRAAPDEAVVREGEPGDCFYLVAAGELEVSIAAVAVNTLGPGDGFGEIALLRDGLRVATVTARTGAELLALGREPFLLALSGSPAASRAAEALVDARVGTLAG